MRCWKCGEELDDNAIFCTRCGEKQDKKRKEQKKWFAVSVLVIILGFLIFGIGAVFLAKREKKEEVKQFTQETKEDMPDTLEEETETESEFQGYSWVVEPEIVADDIYYPVEKSETINMNGKYRICAINELNKQVDNPNAVIQKGEALGVIGMDGELAADLDYKEITGYGQTYMMTRTDPVDTEEFGPDWDIFWLLEDGKIIADVGVGSAALYMYYYCDGLHHTYEDHDSGYEELETAIPVQKSDVIYDISDFDALCKSLSGKYAVFKDGEAVIDFIYDECGSSSEGLLAVCLDGKWGYINEEGENVIPIEYDASWQQYQNMWDYYRNVKDFCYAASGGYVPLVKDGKWELRNTSGELVIPSGVFETIRPVHDGQCWVKKDGKWGVIRLDGAYDAVGSVETDTEEETTGTDAYTEESIAKIVIEHYNSQLEKEYYGNYSISSNETTVTDSEYAYILRFSISEERRQELLAEGILETSSRLSANVLTGRVIVDRSTGDVTMQYADGMEEVNGWNIYDK